MNSGSYTVQQNVHDISSRVHSVHNLAKQAFRYDIIFIIWQNIPDGVRLIPEGLARPNSMILASENHIADHGCSYFFVSYLWFANRYPNRYLHYYCRAKSMSIALKDGEFPIIVKEIALSYSRSYCYALLLSVVVQRYLLYISRQWRVVQQQFCVLY